MINSKELFLELKKKISLEESPEEIEAILYQVFFSLFHLSKTNILVEEKIEVSPVLESQLNSIVDRINQAEPIQYILEQAWFKDRVFYVDPSVLIPRSETEELVALVLSTCEQINSILDIGTGSGCIPISIKLDCPQAMVYATDISEAALRVAKQNALAWQADITFLQHDILTEEIPLDSLDVVVSNPPYVLESEMASLRENVIKFEPHLALFTPTNDPLRFYRVIAEKGMLALKPNGKIFVEINQQFGKEVANLFVETGFQDVTIRKDLFGNDRIVTGTKLKGHV